ncbi:MAG: hypothetical protein IIC84_01635 [Chloroflexi bacterium]|nr:hypothetical protein [Chloroflexota bacterium]
MRKLNLQLRPTRLFILVIASFVLVAGLACGADRGLNEITDDELFIGLPDNLQVDLRPRDLLLLKWLIDSAPEVPQAFGVEFEQLIGDEEGALGNGFGDSHNDFPWSMQWWNGYLYVGTGRDITCVTAATVDRATGSSIYKPLSDDLVCAPTPQSLPLQAEIWRYEPISKVWERVFQSPEVPLPDFPGKFVARDIGFRSMMVFTEPDQTEALYVAGVSSRSLNGNDLPPPRILRSVDGVNFVPIPQEPGTFLYDLPIQVATSSPVVVDRGFRALGEYKDRFYISASDYRGVGVVLESSNPAEGNDSFRQISPPGMLVWDMAIFNDMLYLGLEHQKGYQVVRTDATGEPPYEFVTVVTDGGFKRGQPSKNVLSMYPFKGSLYVGTNRGGLLSSVELIRIHPDDSWDLVIGTPRLTPDGYKEPLSGLAQGAGNRFNGHFWRMAEQDGRLYLGSWDWSIQLRKIPIIHSFTKFENGFDLFVTEDGVDWRLVTKDGFNDGFNYGVRNFASSPYGLFVGAANPFNGLEIWQSVEVPEP